MPIKVKRLSDGHVFSLPDHVNPLTRVRDVKKELHAHLAPKFEHGCRLKYQGKVLKSLHKLTHYGVQENGELEMDDTKNWSSSSSSNGSDKD